MILAVISQDMTVLVAYGVRIRSQSTTGAHLRCSHKTIFSERELAVRIAKWVENCFNLEGLLFYLRTEK